MVWDVSGVGTFRLHAVFRNGRAEPQYAMLLAQPQSMFITRHAPQACGVTPLSRVFYMSPQGRSVQRWDFAFRISKMTTTSGGTQEETRGVVRGSVGAGNRSRGADDKVQGLGHFLVCWQCPSAGGIIAPS